MKNWEKIISEDPQAEQRMHDLEEFTETLIQANSKSSKGISTVTIPVVVHVLHHIPIQNIADEQIIEQIETLNRVFRMNNVDSLPSGHPFQPLAADCNIEFCLAQFDPMGNPTTGITRTFTDSINFKGIGSEKFTNNGGKDNWDPHSYLNIWVCNLGGQGLLGYATWPSQLNSKPQLDGIVIDYRAFGYGGTAGTWPYLDSYLGKTTVHEVGHWLNLRHIWGDMMCGDDFVFDTPPQEDRHNGCPTFPENPTNICGSGINGEMYMNYMDYVDDDCMVMFSKGQSQRMDATLLGPRIALRSSTKCFETVGIDNLLFESELKVYPNPTNGKVFIDAGRLSGSMGGITIRDIIGNIVFSTEENETLSSQKIEIDLANQANGIYFVSTRFEHINLTRVIVKN